MRAHLPILPVLAALTGALLIPVLALARARLAAALACASAGLAAVLAVAGVVEVVGHGTRRYAVAGWPAPWGIELVLDPLSAFVAATIAAVGTVVLVATAPAVARVYGDRAPVFHALALLVIGGLLGIVASGDLFNVFVFLEVASIASYALVATGGGPALLAAFRYLVIGSVGASFYLLGVGMLYALTGSLNMADVAGRAAGSGSPLLAGGLVFAAVGLAVKMGLFPLHGWVPDAYGHAPAPVVALIAPIASKAAAYALARIFLHVVQAAGTPAGSALALAGAAAIVVGGVLAVRQTDARRLLAWSSVSQIGYVALGLGLANTAALAGAFLHILAHACPKAALFLAVGAAALRGRGVAVGAIGRGMPVTAACAVVAGVSLVGLPPAAGFFSKWYLLQGALDAGRPAAAGVILAGSLLAAAYTYRLIGHVFDPRPEPAPGGEAPPLLLAGLAALALATVVIGLASAPLVDALLLPAARLP